MRYLFLMLLFTAFSASAQEPCDRPASVRVSAEEMAKVLCQAAENGRFQPDTESLISECKIGLKNGAVAVGESLLGSVIGVKDMAVAAGSKAAGWIKSAWADSGDAAVAAEKAAKANTEESKSWLKSVADYADASKMLIQTFLEEFGHNLRLVGSSMQCLPLKITIKYICQFVNQVALELLTLKTVATAVDKGVAAGKAVNEFMRKSNMVEELRGASLSTRIKAAGESLEHQAQYKMVERFGESGNLRSRIDPISGNEKLYFEEIAVREGKRLSSLHEIPRDAKTLAVDANFEWGKQLAKRTAESTKDGHLVFIDVNNLGKVNYFKGGTQAGDEYLSAVSQAIRKQLRADDRFFKNGGDELVLVLQTKNPAEVKSVMERIHQAIEKDQNLQRLFKQERTAVAAGIRASKAKPNAEQVVALQATAKIRPSVSIGSTKISGDWSADLARAERQAGQVKAVYKSDIGLETAKYGLKETAAGGPARFIAKPKVLDPVE